MTNPNDSAYPIDKEITIPQESLFVEGELVTIVRVGRMDSIGLTKREYFAAMALQGLMSNTNTGTENWQGDAECAVEIADKLIEELNKQQ